MDKPKTFINKYAPKNTKDIIGQESGVNALRNFLTNYKKQRKKAMLLYGPSGCGKTSAAYAVAEELGLDVIEINASDCRNKGQIHSIVGVASKQMSLFFRGKLILIDELDGIAGREDYGGVPALVDVIKNSYWPVVITANNPYDNKFSSVRNASEMIMFRELSSNDLFFILKNICDAEKIKYEEDALKTLARRNAGDARGAINDLHIVSVTGPVDEKSLNDLSMRDKTDTIHNALTKIFKSTDVNVAKEAFEFVDEDLDKCFLWVDENLPLEYTEQLELARAYENLSRADVFYGRITRWQHWLYLTYVNDLMTAGIASAKDVKNRNFVEYKPTGRILKMWWAKQKNMKKKAIAEKIAEKTHLSAKDVRRDIDFFKIIFKNNSEMASKIANEFELDAEEVAYLKK
jgi:replication factor C large subunit